MSLETRTSQRPSSLDKSAHAQVDRVHRGRVLDEELEWSRLRRALVDLLRLDGGSPLPIRSRLALEDGSTAEGLEPVLVVGVVGVRLVEEGEARVALLAVTNLLFKLVRVGVLGHERRRLVDNRPDLGRGQDPVKEPRGGRIRCSLGWHCPVRRDGTSVGRSGQSERRHSGRERTSA